MRFDMKNVKDVLPGQHAWVPDEVFVVQSINDYEDYTIRGVYMSRMVAEARVLELEESEDELHNAEFGVRVYPFNVPLNYMEELEGSDAPLMTKAELELMRKNKSAQSLELSKNVDQFYTYVREW
jgi:hypothetical protein